jgi:hypothetical protein
LFQEVKTNKTELLAVGTDCKDDYATLSFFGEEIILYDEL